ncbi:MAG: hypothetical protein ACI9UT_000443 [Flavobacteriales bacterium]|jgi:hypothetical protein
MNNKLTLSSLTLLLLLVSNVTVGQEKSVDENGDEDWSEYQEVDGVEDDDEDWSDYEEVGGDGQTVEIVTYDSEEPQETEALASQNYDTFTRFTPYYSSAGMVFKLTKEPNLQIGKSDEFEVYKDLFLRSYIPEWATLEFSVYPLPLLGVGLKKHYSSTYDKFELSDTSNLVESATAGFEEPYSLTLLLNNVTSYNANENSDAPNVDFMGYLISGGTHHIQNNELIRDNWYELAWKVKGKFSTGSKIFSWSFELGSKNHAHNEITDTVFVGIKRDRIDYDGPVWSFLDNTGFELRYSADRNDLATVEQRFLVTKFFPKLRYKKMIFSLTMGVIHETALKYSGDLALNQRSNQTLFVIRPSIYF